MCPSQSRTPLVIALAIATGCGRPVARHESNLVTITVRDYAFDAPATIPAGLTTLRLVNQGRFPHQALLFKVPDGHDAAEVRKVLMAGTEPGWAILPSGGPGGSEGGGESNTTQVLDAGHYVLICFFVGGGAPHFTFGMVRDLIVQGPSPAGVVEPRPDVTVSLYDYGFRFSEPLARGAKRLRVENQGPQDHEFMVFRLQPGGSEAELTAWLEGRRSEWPPLAAVGGVSALPSGSHAFTDLLLQPGEYVLVCDTPDAKDGRPHRDHGMRQRVHIN